MEGILYLICDPLNDSYKIGVTTRKNVDKRLKELQTGNSSSLFVMQTFYSKHLFQLERVLHKHFYGKKELNEWFKLDADDCKYFLDNCRKYENIFDTYESNINCVF